MNWFSNLANTYDAVSDIAGVADEKGNVLWPLYHMAMKSDVAITIDGAGIFRHAEKSERRIIIPYTEDSSSRAGKVIFPQPLHEKVDYLALDVQKRKAYLEQLSAWCKLHPKVEAVYKYVAAETLLGDLEKSGIQAKESLFVRFRVEIPEDNTPNLWEDMEVCQVWTGYYTTKQTNDKELCFAIGQESVPVQKHLKGINTSANGAKLVSCNDDTYFTYRGRFWKPEQANAIGAEASHKTHAMLNYLISTQGYRCDTQAVVAWTIENGGALPNPFIGTYDLYSDVIKSPVDMQMEARAELGIDYAAKLREALSGLGNAKKLSNTSRRAVIMAVDAATTGRMSITFYQDLPENEYIDRIIAWHEACRWHFIREGIEHITAPSVDKIIRAVYGEPKGEGYKKIQKQSRERLLHTIVCGEPIDRGWVSAAVSRVTNPFSFNKTDGGWDKAKWENAVNVACALVRKHYNRKEEGFILELDGTCTDRSYLFGRLLAIADKIESHARYLQEKKDDTDKRPTNAVRYMQAFASKPLRTWKLIFDNLNPYIRRLDGAEGYQRQIDEIMSLFVPDEFSDEQLTGKYLLGYSLQRRSFHNQKNKNDQEEEISNESIEKD